MSARIHSVRSPLARRSLADVSRRAFRKQLIGTVEAELRKLRPPGNAGCKGEIVGVPVQRYAVHYDVDGTKAFDVPSAAALLIERASTK